MKYIFIIQLFICSVCVAQYPNVHGNLSNSHTLESYNSAMEAKQGFINGRYDDTVTANLTHIKDYPGAQIVTGNTFWLRDSTATKWILSGGLFLRQGGAITSLPFIGFDPNTVDIPAWIDTVFYRAQPPTATLTGGVTVELQAPTTLTTVLNYTSGRQSATKPLSTIVVAGVSESFVQPAQGASVSGTQSVSYAANTDITYSNVTTATDGQSATATTTFAFLPKRYWGWVSDTADIGTVLYNDANITSLNNELSNSKVKNFNTGDPSGVQFLVYAYYSTAGVLTHFDMNGFPSIDAMNVVTRTFTNALGYSGTWIIYWSKNGQTLSSTVIAN